MCEEEGGVREGHVSQGREVIVLRGLYQRLLLLLPAVMVVMAGVVWFGVSGAVAAPVPAWHLSVEGVPSVLPVGVGRQGRFIVIAQNTGSAPSEAGGVLRDVLPPGLTAKETGCAGDGTGEVACPLPEGIAPGGLWAVFVTFEETGSLTPGSSLVNRVTVGGGGGSTVTGDSAIRARRAGEVGPGPGGIESFSMTATGPNGAPVSQAAGHPSLFTASAMLNSQFPENVSGSTRPAEAPRDLVFYLPLGLLGDVLVADKCPPTLVETHPEATGCPPGSNIGSIMTLIGSAAFIVEHGIYNVPPEKGYAAEFAFTNNGFTFFSYVNVVRRDGTVRGAYLDPRGP